MHADERRAAQDQPEGTVEVLERRLLGRVADEDRGRRGTGRPASSCVSRCWPANSSLASSDARTYSGWPGKCRAVYAADAESADRNRSGGMSAPEAPRPERQAVPAHGGRVGHDPVREARRLERARSASAAPGINCAGRDDHAVHVEQQRAHPCERRPQRGRRRGRLGGHRPMVGCRRRRRAARTRMGLLDGKNGAHLRGRERSLDRLGHRPGPPRRGRRGRLQLRREPHREARPAAGRLDRIDLRGALRRPVGRGDRPGLRAVGRDPRVAWTSWSTRWRSREREDLEGTFVDTSRDGFALAMDVSAYSLVALTRAARPYLRARLVRPDPDLLRGGEGRRRTTT